jgi:hypothetical protein
MAPEPPDPKASSSSPRPGARPGPSATQLTRRPPQPSTAARRPTLRMGPLTTTPIPPPERSGALGRLGSTSAPRLDPLARSGTTGRLTGSGAQSRTGSGAAARPGGPLTSLPSGGTVSLLRARAGRHGLVFDLRAVRHVDEFGLPAREVGRVVDLRALFEGPDTVVAFTPGQTLAAAGPDDERLTLVVDAGEVELLRVTMDAIHPLPSPLRRVPALACVRALVVLADGAVALLVDPARLTPALASSGPSASEGGAGEGVPGRPEASETSCGGGDEGGPRGDQGPPTAPPEGGSP